MTLDEKIAAIRAGLEGVTPGPWFRHKHHVGSSYSVDEWISANDPHMKGIAWEMQATNAAHIARLDPDTVRELLAEIDRLRTESDRLNDHIEVLKAKIPDTDCACGYDAPDDVCLVHSPALDAARAEIERLKGEMRELNEDLGRTRMCLNCGTVVDAEHPRTYPLPRCVDSESGLSACTFDTTPQEAMVIWRDRYYTLRSKNDGLRAALRPFAALHAEIVQCAAMCDETDPARDPKIWFKGCSYDDLAAAAKALEGSPSP